MTVQKKPSECHDVQQLLNDMHNHNVNLCTREIYLHSHYSATGYNPEDEPGIEYKCATQFVKNLHVLDSQSDANILVRMQLTGGDSVQGMAMFDAIRAARSPVTILAYGEAASMSGILLQAADIRVLMPHCTFMMHHGFIGVDDNAVAAKAYVRWCDLQDEEMLRIFAERAIKGPLFKSLGSVEVVVARIQQELDKTTDWYLTAAQTVQYGFCDGIFGTKGFETIEKIRRCRT